MTSSPLVLVESLSGDCACDREALMCLNGGRVLVGVPGEGENSLCCFRGGESQKEESKDLSAFGREGEEWGVAKLMSQPWYLAFTWTTIYSVASLKVGHVNYSHHS